MTSISSVADHTTILLERPLLSKGRPNVVVNRHREIGGVLPAVLLISSALAALFRIDEIFLTCSFLAGLVSLRVLFLLVVRPGHLRFTWLLATGLLLGYGLGSFNTAIQIFMNGFGIANVVRHSIDELCVALAATGAICAFLYSVGPLIENPVRLNWTAVQRSDQFILWVCLAVTAAAYASGGTGYMGTQHSDAQKESALGAVAATLAPILPAFTVLVFRRLTFSVKSLHIWALLLIEAALLLPQGRRVLLYSTVVFFLALILSGIKFKLNLKTVLLLFAAAVALFLGNKLFFAMRYQRSQMGNRAKLGLVQNIGGALDIVASGDSKLGSQLDKNLRDRTLVLGYFSDMLAASWHTNPMWGRAAVFNIRFAIPSAIDRNKDEVLSLGAEESLVNPEFGLKARDEANSILTTGIADFGLSGAFLYPLVLAVSFSAVFWVVAKFLPPGIAIFVFLGLVDLFIQTEVGTNAYIIALRNLLLISGGLSLVDKIRKSLPRSSDRK